MDSFKPPTIVLKNESITKKLGTLKTGKAFPNFTVLIRG
jgi:hypothetical protein